TYEDAGILDRTHLRFFTYQEILRMFEAADFTVEQMRNVKIAISEKDTALIATLAEIGKVPAHYFESYQYLIGAMK
ncbi:MAG: glycosyl transferase, partial [Hungatella sp.]